MYQKVQAPYETVTSGYVMSESSAVHILEVIGRHGRSRTALMDILREVQASFRHVPPEAMTQIAHELAIPRVEVEGFVSFYSFLTEKPHGNIVIRVSDDVSDRMKGFGRVMDAFKQALGIEVGETTPDGGITLATTACIGLSDQAPAALVNGVPVTNLGTDRAWEIVRELQSTGDPKRLVKTLGEGNNAHPLVHSMVKNNIQIAGPIHFSPQNRGEAIRKALKVSPAEVIRAVKAARLRGRGGAGFPTGMKWEFTRAAPGDRKVVICNADEGEPGTFKDRVLLTERPDRIFAGMTIAGYAIGASEGILYLRAEYEYLRAFLEDVLEGRRADGLLGERVAGHTSFSFDIRIQVGAGAYICGEESALMNSCEGRRGDPRNRPPFPAEKGFLGLPTTVNNVETLSCVTRILEAGSASFAEHGTPQSTGTKLLSVSGDCWKPGVYEVPFGITVVEVLDRIGASEVQAIQVGGPSGCMIGPSDFMRTICFDDLATAGSFVVFGPERNLLQVVRAYQRFFAEESCGYCTPCRVGNTILLRYIDRLVKGRGEPRDLRDMERLARTMKTTSRCGLGQTACNPVLTTLSSFRPVYDAVVSEAPNRYRRSFDLAVATAGHDNLRRRNGTEPEALPDWAD